MKHEIEERQGASIVVFTGEIDLESSPALQAAKKNGSRLSLAAVSEPTRRVLELARLDKVFTIFDSVDEALA
jgi:anti-anti-sigma regulatory factor